MNRTIGILFVVVVIVGVAASQLYQKNESKNVRHAQISILTNGKIAVEDVKVVKVKYGENGEQLEYRMQNDKWQLPQYGNAFADASIVESIVKDIVDAKGVPVDQKDKKNDWYGISTESKMIELQDGSGTTVANVVLGSALPGMWGGDSYAMSAEEKQILHINSNPLPKLISGDSQPSMIDRRIIPGAVFGSMEICGMEIFGDAGAESVSPIVIGRRERELSEDEKNTMPPAMRDTVFYQWYAVVNDSEILLDEKQTEAYSAFLSRVNFSGIASNVSTGALSGKQAIKSMNIFFCDRPTGDDDAKIEMHKHLLSVYPGDSANEMLLTFDDNPAAMKIPSKKVSYIFPPLQMLSEPTDAQPFFNSISY